MQGLERVNLLVGANNSGKTSLLEAIELLASANQPHFLFQGMKRRGEFKEEREGTLTSPVFQAYSIYLTRCLFHRYSLEQRGFSLSSHWKGVEHDLQAEFVTKGQHDFQWIKKEFHSELLNKLGVQSSFHHLALGLPSFFLRQEPVLFPCNNELHLRDDQVSFPVISEPIPHFYIRSTALDDREIGALYDKIALSKEEDLVIQAMQLIDPDVLRLATVSDGWSRNKIMLRHRSSSERIPLGSLGDGVTRLLGIALGLVNARGGVLLVDEIDTGLHFTVLEKMWRLILQTASQLDVQVFATTHNSDCWKSLASVLTSDAALGEASIQRIEVHRQKSVVFSTEEIQMAAQHGIEVR